MPKIFLIDVTNRDGVQTARLGLSKLEKTMINIYLNDMGVFQSEFGLSVREKERKRIQSIIGLGEMAEDVLMRQ